MSKTRPILELLKIILKSYKDVAKSRAILPFLCNHIACMDEISDREFDVVMAYIKDNIPLTREDIGYDDSLITSGKHTTYDADWPIWGEQLPDGSGLNYRSRINFLKGHIKLLESRSQTNSLTLSHAY